MASLRTKFLILLSLGLISSTLCFGGGGWATGNGVTFLKLGQYVLRAQHYYTPAGDRVPIITTGVYTTSVYVEYGLSDRLTVVGYVPLFSRSTLNRAIRPDGSLIQEGDQVNGLGDAEVSFKYSFFQKGPWALAAGLTLGIPLGTPEGGSTGLLQTGDGEFNQLFTVDASRSFWKGKGYATLSGGFNHRTEGFSEEIRYGIEGGYRVGQFWLIARLYGIESLKNGEVDLSANNGIFSNNLEYTVFSPEVSYETRSGWGISAAFGTAFRGERVLADPSYSTGVYFKF